jgi:GDPmannose 4,6-dehydratase
MRALITGITGQDGAYLARFLLDKGYYVCGLYRRVSSPNFWRLQALDVLDKIDLIAGELIDGASLVQAVRSAKPRELYHLAAQSFVGASFEQPIGTGNVTGLGVARVLEAVRIIDPEIRISQASTSELYGNTPSVPQSESTPFEPASPYASAKLYGHSLTKVYREAYGLFACNGILFNHESPLRGLEFVTRKISNVAARIKLGHQKELRLGNLESRRDWGFAPDYVEAMWLMLQQPQPDDYVVATNEMHSVEEFARLAFAALDLDWQRYVRSDEALYRPLDVMSLQGDNGKVQARLGWTPKVRFAQLVQIMVEADYDRWRRWERGERFPWDAPNFSTEASILSRNHR